MPDCSEPVLLHTFSPSNQAGTYWHRSHYSVQYVSVVQILQELQWMTDLWNSVMVRRGAMTLMTLTQACTTSTMVSGFIILAF